MAKFEYQAHREDQTEVEGLVEAEDLDSAVRSLQHQGLTVALIQPVQNGSSGSNESTANSSVAAEHTALQRQLRRVLERGDQLAPALLAYSQEMPAGGRRRRLEQIASQLAQGNDLSAELVAEQIDEPLLSLLCASASSNDPSHILSGIIDQSQQTDDLRRTLGEVLAYPLLLMISLLGMLALLAWWIMPAFEEMFADFGMQTPALTRVVFGISQAIRNSFGLVIILPVLVLAGVFALFCAGPRSAWKDGIIQRVPLIGPTARLADRMRFTRCLADLLDANVGLGDALRISGRNTGQTDLRHEVHRLASALDSGGQLADVPIGRQALPRTVMYLLNGKGLSPAAAPILRELSWMYEDQTRNRLAWLTSIMGPLFIILLGSVVGLIVIALFLPLISLLQALS